MSFQRRWSLIALGSFLALAAVGSWGCCSLKYCGPVARIVTVSPTADGVSIDPVVISKKAKQEIVWRLPAASTIAYVAITPRVKPGTEQTPFERCQVVEGVCRIACGQGVCLSGPINPALPVLKAIYYDYTFGHSAAQASLDPGIRIDP